MKTLEFTVQINVMWNETYHHFVIVIVSFNLNPTINVKCSHDIDRFDSDMLYAIAKKNG